MAVVIELPEAIEQRLRQNITNLDQVVGEAALVELYRNGQLTHHELATALGLDRFGTEAILKLHRVTEDLIALADHDNQLRKLEEISGR